MTTDDRTSYDGLRGNVIFCAWTGTNPLSPQRADCLLSIYRETCCPVLLLTPANIAQWSLEETPFHPAFPYLSETHKADYLRCYIMHHFGGGYTDIKKTGLNWMPLFDRMRRSDAFGLGYTEIGPHGVSPIPEPLGSEVRQNFHRLIGNCAYILRRRSEFTTQWLDETHRILDSKLHRLVEHPSRHPMDQTDVILPNGDVSHYPLRWAEILGEIFHPLVYKHADRFLHGEIAPQFYNYR